MKYLSLFFYLLSLPIRTLAQEAVTDTNYYTPPAHRRPVLSADPDQNPRHSNTGRLAANRRHDADLAEQIKEIQIWYISAEGGFRSDGSTLSNSFNRLVSNPTPVKAVWGILVGYTYQNSWAIEAGYTQAPIHLNIKIDNGSNPLTYNYQNGGYGLPLRVKRRIGSGNRSANGTGFWLTAGAWLIPNGNVSMDDFRLIGYVSRNRGNRNDTLRLTNTTTTINRVTGLAEAGIDYTVRLSSFLELGIYLRKYWGLGDALRSDLTYTINNTSTQQAAITSDGTGWGLGMSLRYIYGRQHVLKKSF